jgi:hypothetical protein
MQKVNFYNINCRENCAKQMGLGIFMYTAVALSHLGTPSLRLPFPIFIFFVGVFNYFPRRYPNFYSNRRSLQFLVYNHNDHL